MNRDCLKAVMAVIVVGIAQNALRRIPRPPELRGPN